MRTTFGYVSAGCIFVAVLGCGSSDPAPEEGEQIGPGGAGATGAGGGAGNGGAMADAGRAGAAGATGGRAGTGGAAGGAGGPPGSGGSPGSGGAGGSPGSGGAGGSPGSAGSGDSGVVTPPTCASPNSALPGDAPVLIQGTWKDISPAGGGLSFGGGGNLTQGMALDPCNAATLYACICASGGSASYPKGIYRSTNAGTSWIRILPDDSPNHVRVDPKNPLNLYVTDGVAGGTAGFYRTTDGGLSWDHKTNMCDVEGITSSCGMNDLYDVAVDPLDFKHVLISFHSPWTWGDSSKGAGILESRDGGDTWKAIHYPNNWGYGHSISFLYKPELGIGDSGTWMLGIQNGGGRWRTTDWGATWNKVSDVSIVHGGGNVYYTKTGILYASADTGVIRSTDNGATWTSLGRGFGSIGVMGDGKLLYIGPLFGPAPFSVANESDGTTWSDYNAQTFSQGPFEMAFDAVNGILYSASNNAGVWALKVK